MSRDTIDYPAKIKAFYMRLNDQDGKAPLGQWIIITQGLEK